MIIKVLDGVRILICRPDPAATELATALESVGAECHCLPAIDRVETQLSPQEKTILLNLDQYDRVIAVSELAAKLGMAQIDEYWPQLPDQQVWHAIGRKTAQTLRSELSSFNVELVAPDADYTSEQLLASIPSNDLQQSKVLLLKGKGGRTLMMDQLTQAGALVDEVCLYERKLPDYPKERIEAALNHFKADVIVTLSAETLSNTLALADSIKTSIHQKHFVVSSERVARFARKHGIKSTRVPDGLMPIDLIKLIAELKRNTL